MQAYCINIENIQGVDLKFVITFCYQQLIFFSSTTYWHTFIFLWIINATFMIITLLLLLLWWQQDKNGKETREETEGKSGMKKHCVITSTYHRYKSYQNVWEDSEFIVDWKRATAIQIQWTQVFTPNSTQRWFPFCLLLYFISYVLLYSSLTFSYISSLTFFYISSLTFSYISPAPVHSVGFSFFIFWGFLAVFILLSSNYNFPVKQACQQITYQLCFHHNYYVPSNYIITTIMCHQIT